MSNGTVKIFNESQGFGLISPDAGTTDVFVHVSVLERAGIAMLKHGQRVAFKVGVDRHGRAAVRNIQLIADLGCSTQAARG